MAKTVAGSDPTFTDAQLTFLKTYEAEFRAYMLANSGGDKAQGQTAAKKWKDENCPAILAKIKTDYPYPTLWSRSTTDGDVKAYIRRYFGNLLHGNLVRTGALQPVPAPSNNALFTASRPATGRELFAKEQKDDIMEQSKNLKKPGANTAGCYQAALKMAWDNEDDEVKAKYQLAAEEQAAAGMNIPQNQLDFERNIGGTLQDLCNGALGPAEMVLLASFRNASGGISTFVVEGHSEQNDRSFSDFYPTFPVLRKSWDSFSEEVLPAALTDRTDWNMIPRNSEGIPIFPSVDLDNITRLSLAQVTELYLRVCWDNSWPSDKVYPTLPLSDVAQTPDDFYDTTQFSFKPTLGEPLTSLSLSQLGGMVEYFIAMSTTETPFVFREKNDILVRREAMRTEEPPKPVPETPSDESTTNTDIPTSLPALGVETAPVPPLGSGTGDGASTETPLPPRTGDEDSRKDPETELEIEKPSKSRKRKAAVQLIPNTSEAEAEAGTRRSVRKRQTVEEAAAERQQKASEAATRHKPKPGYSYRPKTPPAAKKQSKNGKSKV
ncbi:hypothetical protein B0H11DRAFT_2213804 [Mycena galericulata]|nr:hypothetical protein B0H11DRAFT_2213804 [Mycena galericulata]